MSSEGENILMNIGNYAAKIGRAVTSVLTKENKELWVFFDAADSRLSIDGIKEIKNELFSIIEEDCKTKGVELYIVVMNLQMESSVLMSITASTEHLKITMNTQNLFVHQGKLKIKDMV